jgi:GNAT superfamily N-acetyltransferase/catechol 2,3-dioxygenase-like lactoylglutathione lyase family enzyme
MPDHDPALLASARVATRLPAKDLQRARRFYAEKLGLEPSEERPGGLLYHGAAGDFALFASAGRPDGGHTQIAFDVDDIEATVAELRRRGVVFEHVDLPGLKTIDAIAEVSGNYPSKGTGERAAWFRDSEGNMIAIGQVTGAIEFRRCDAAQPPASDLIDAVLAEYRDTATRTLHAGPSATPQDFSPPGGAYVVGFVEDEPACGGGIKALGDATAELKRMYVVPKWRRRGVAQGLLTQLEDTARELGHDVVRLDCLAATWPLYARAGYREIDDYNANPNAEKWGEKSLRDR